MSLWDLQIIAICFYLHFTQCPNFFGNEVVKHRQQKCAMHWGIWASVLWLIHGHFMCLKMFWRKRFKLKCRTTAVLCKSKAQVFRCTCASGYPQARYFRDFQMKMAEREPNKDPEHAEEILLAGLRMQFNYSRVPHNWGRCSQDLEHWPLCLVYSHCK